MKGTEKLFRNFLHISLLFLSHSPAAQELIFRNGIYAEKVLPANTDEHAYSKDNISYKTGMQFIFDYYFLAPASAEKKKFVYDPASHKQSFDLSDYNKPEKNAICKIRMTVTDDLFTFGFDSSYSQTVFRYDYLNAANSELTGETTGTIDNLKNLWLHPPRYDQFAILELNPFPFQNLNENIKNWDWKLEVGSHWADPRWKSWKDIITIHHKYQRAKDESVDTRMGRLLCKVVQASGTCEINGELYKTYLKSWYHPDFGFVRLEYTNINGTRLIMELTGVKRPAPDDPDKKLLAEYHQNCCAKYFNEALKLYSDSSFEYAYEETTGKEKHHGIWRTDKDTLLLYDYIHPALENDTLNGNESLIALKDSVEITFVESGNKGPAKLPFTINGRCFQPDANDRYPLPPGGINFISAAGGKYFVKNKSSNKIQVFFNINVRYLKASRVRNISKCLLTDKYIAKINCDGQLNGAYKLDKK